MCKIYLPHKPPTLPRVGLNFRWGNYAAFAVLPDVCERGGFCGAFRPTAVPAVQLLPNRKAASPSRFLVRKSLAVANSSPIKPSRISHVRMANFGLSCCWGFGLAVLTIFAI